MNDLERNLVWVTDNQGKEFLCTLDSECNDALESNRKIPQKFEELSMCERVSCRDVDEVLGVEWW
jgi:hypothetical protein